MIKLKQLLFESDAPNIFIPRRMEDRKERYRDIVLRKIQDYIKNGSKGNLDLSYTPITSLPDNLTVKGGLNLSYTPITSLPNNLTVGKSLFLHNTPLSKKYSKDEIRKMIEDKGGSVSRDIYM